MKGFIIIVFGALVAFGIIAAINPEPKSNTVPQISSEITKLPSAQADLLSLELRLDDTESILPEDRERGISVLLKIAEEAIDSGEFSSCKIQHLGKRGWLTEEVNVRLPRRTEPPCPQPSINNDLQRYKKYVEKQQKKAERNCQERHSNSEVEYDAARDSALAEIEKALRTTEQSTSDCTAFLDSLASAAMTRKPSTIVIMSDGVDTCAAALRTLPTPAHDVKIILVMVPSRHDQRTYGSAFAAFDKRKGRIQRRAPWLQIEPPIPGRVRGIV